MIATLTLAETPVVEGNRISAASENLGQVHATRGLHLSGRCLVDMFGSMGYTLVIDQPFDLTDQASGFFHATMDSLGEYRLIALTDDQLFLGDRSV